MTFAFGYDPNYLGNSQHIHWGCDFGLPAGTPVLAVADGQVVVAAENYPRGLSGVSDGAWGNYVEVRHPDGEHSGYCHLQGLNVYTSQPVRAGQMIGLSGFTGLVIPKGPDGAHLHFQRLVGGKRVDPAARLT